MDYCIRLLDPQPYIPPEVWQALLEAQGDIMANIFTEIAGFLKDGAADIVKAVAWVGHIATDVEKLFASGVLVGPPTISAIVTVINDVENLALLASGAVGADGLNFTADSAVYAAFEQLLKDLKTLGTQINTDIGSIETAK
jgi:hypothetical protein